MTKQQELDIASAFERMLAGAMGAAAVTLGTNLTRALVERMAEDDKFWRMLEQEEKNRDIPTWDECPSIISDIIM